jgi:hypothetical protein
MIRTQYNPEASSNAGRLTGVYFFKPVGRPYVLPGIRALRLGNNHCNSAIKAYSQPPEKCAHIKDASWGRQEKHNRFFLRDSAGLSGPIKSWIYPFFEILLR